MDGECLPCAAGEKIARRQRQLTSTVKVFIGGGPEHWLPAAVLANSIRRHTDRKVEIVPLLDVENSHPIPPEWKERCPTRFSLQRFLIPAACRYEGWGIYLDSDQIVLGDIGDLWNTEFPEHAKVLTTGNWQSAVILIDCLKTRWDVNQLCGMMEQGFKYAKISSLKFMNEAEVVGALDPRWNCMDELPKDGKPPLLLHLTDMARQPWCSRNHPLSDIWINELLIALEMGMITTDDVLRDIELGNVRPGLKTIIGCGVVDPKEDDEFYSRYRAAGCRVDRMKPCIK